MSPISLNGVEIYPKGKHPRDLRKQQPINVAVDAVEKAPKPAKTKAGKSKSSNKKK